MKKWTYLAVAGMLLGSAPVFTGCVDTDEPWGVEQLRGAKAELLKAKAAVEQANAAIKQAQVAYVEAQTREKNAIALQQEMLAEKLRLENEWKQLENDEKRAEVEKRLAEIEQEMEAAALDHEKNMIDKQAALEEAKRQYEIVMQQIAISEAIGSEQAKVTLESLKAAVQEAYDVLYADQTESNWPWGEETVIENSSLEDKLYEASEKLYDAIQNQKKGYDTGKQGQIIKDKEYWPATLEAIVAQYEAVLEVEQTALDKLIAASELPTEETDWRNQVDAMGEEIDALKEERDQKQLAIKEAQAAPEYISAWQNAYGVFDKKPSEFGETEKDIRKYIKDNSLTPSKNGTMQLRDEAKQKLNKAKKDTDIKIAAYSLPEGMEVSDRVMQALGFTKPADGENRDYFSYGESTYKWLDVDKQPADSAELPQDIQWYLQERYDKWLEPFETAIIPANEKAQAEAKLAAAKKAETAAQTAYDAAVKNWQAVLDITSAQKDYTEIDKTTFQTAVNAYKNAYTALNTAITNWNNALQTAYDEAKTAEETKLKNAEIVNAFEDDQIEKAFADNGNTAALGSIKSGWNGTAKDRAALTSLLNLYCQPNGQTSKAAVIAALEDEFDAYLDEVTGSRDWQAAHEADIETAAKKGVTDFKTEDAADEDGLAAALATAKTNLQNAYDNADETKVDLVNAVDAFKESAIGFAQSVNATALNAVNMVKAANTTTVDENWYTNDKNFQETGVYTYKILNSNIEDKEVTDATTVKFNPNWENVAVIPGTLEISFKDGSTSYKDNTLNALEYRSYLAFGLADRYVAPERDEVENIDQITFGSDDTTGDSKAEILYAAKADVERQEAIISAQDDLKKLQETLTAAKTAFEAQVAADYKENFGELQTAYTTAENNHTATVDALAQVEEKLFGELDAEIDKLTAQIKANQTVYNKLKALAWKYLGITWPDKDPNDTNNPYEKPAPDSEYDPASFEADLKEAIAQQQRIVAEAEQDVQEAKVNLEQANSGEYDGVHYFQFQLDKVQREWDRAYAAYQEAMENLEKAMAIIAENGGSTEGEQPAE